MKGRGWLKKEAVQKKNCAASISITRICFDIKMKLQQLVKKLVHKNNNLIPKLIFLFWCKWMYFYCLDLYPQHNALWGTNWATRNPFPKEIWKLLYLLKIFQLNFFPETVMTVKKLYTNTIFNTICGGKYLEHFFFVWNRLSIHCKDWGD